MEEFNVLLVFFFIIASFTNSHLLEVTTNNNMKRTVALSNMNIMTFQCRIPAYHIFKGNFHINVFFKFKNYT